MYIDPKLDKYRKESPKNRAEKRELLKKQGWYYRVVILRSLLGSSKWACYKVYRDKRQVLVDQQSESTV